MSDEGAPNSPSLPASVDAALGRLTRAVERLRATAGQHGSPRAAHDPAPADRDAELTRLAEDRARLAERLDLALARIVRLGEAHGAALERIDRAERAVTAVLRDMDEDDDDEEGSPPDQSAQAQGVS